MKFESTAKFDREYKKLSIQERALFKSVLAIFIETCRHYEQHPKAFIWPASLRFEKLVGYDQLYAITWSFKQPDGRATFSLDTREDEVWVLWRRVGRHDIYKEP